ncbi:OmpA family protein [Colwellia sp. 1_MG-2023]|uniref:OmpA family protein n=1 Tax=unclassified Colwellia TaxID=196834 RepID=UPI001C0A1695|nr:MULTISPECIES: OmpA family protein [unclassified Colwellia]MBU2926386.1 OmpA family protein [Colwellia sp. C2M11]MDO6651824.1 OmpA family protein [Colwellia sp. 3_MG-2023]MDO6665265.1 OmpA family protein [Colwellia sp. 2_MG-2023]MDO6689638.1 OmpA family protein [Colwellia sp. 1_MG-2023]
MSKSTEAKQVESQQQLEQLRSLILGKNSHVVTDAIQKEARTIVGEVLSEALHDRQKKDGSVNKVLLPIVENAVEDSVAHNSDRLVNSLYPLMGSLVRKSVTAFLTDFMEKTNQLIDSSLTFKGLTWRIKAWQAGVKFSQYVASQTFVYRVEHVFLIHRETGLLLNSVNFNNTAKSDADLISSMLTAINDFVGDSFLDNEDGLKEQLETVTTDNFTLLIKPGPNALVVAAVTGKPPQKVSDKLQIILESIHSLYASELMQFNGDNEAFVTAENLLRDCLLAEQKTTEPKNNKTPWFAWLAVLFFIIILGFQTVKWWENQVLNDKLMTLDHESGVVINHIEVQDHNKVVLDILRDPDAISVSDWLQKNDLTIEQLSLTERLYHSLDLEILNTRAQRILLEYPEITMMWHSKILHLSGTLAVLKSAKLLSALTAAGFTLERNLIIEDIKPPFANEAITSKAIKAQIFKDLVGRISTIQLEFPVASADVTPSMQLTLQQLYQYFHQLNQLADQLDLNVGLVIIGCSDNSGSIAKNTLLSRQRGENTGDALNLLGLSKAQMYVTGLGQIDIMKVKNNARKVIFNVLYVSNDEKTNNEM